MSQTVPKTANLRAENREAERKRVTLSPCPHTPAASHGGICLRWEGPRQAKFLRAVGVSHYPIPQENHKQASRGPGVVSSALRRRAGELSEASINYVVKSCQEGVGRGRGEEEEKKGRR